MNLKHKLEDISNKSSGLNSSKTALSQAVYTDLVLAKKWKEVDYLAVQSLDSCVFLAKEPGCNEQLFILPMLQENVKLSVERIANIFDSISKEVATDTAIEKLTLAIYAPDSTIVYYHIKKGLARSTQRN